MSGNEARSATGSIDGFAMAGRHAVVRETPAVNFSKARCSATAGAGQAIACHRLIRMIY
jgi:hypothetical protein